MKDNESMDRLLRRASHVPGHVRPPGTCLDADTLAAWADSTLRHDERAAAEAHAADCERCLSLVAAMSKTAPPGEPAAGFRWFSIRWMVPLATAAIAITAWVLVERAPARPDLAIQREPARETPAAEPTAPGVRAEADASTQPRSSEPQKSAPAPAPPPLRDSAGAPRSEARAADKGSASAKAAPADTVTERSAEAAGAAPPEMAPPGSSSTPPVSASPSPTSLGRADRVAETVQSRARFVSDQPFVIVSADRTIQWRVSDAAIERSADGGRTWQAQNPPVPGLVAGSSPSHQVCWLVGRAGAVVLTTDGETWRRLEFPDGSADLVRVSARDATIATVTAMDGRSFHTTDGGRTWTLQENLPAPF